MPSYIEVYLNGSKIEQLRCAYLGHPHSAKSAHCYFAIPMDGKEAYKTPFSFQMGPTFYIEETLVSEETMRAIFYLGYEYEANLQDISGG